uniref:Tc1-like transposase DDE domain-containing protein n=1 Tax=Astyanax mexicanus TaxID=7994 RepID=A0A8B9KP78_ASTMX
IQHDNARPHTAAFLRAFPEDTDTKPCPAASPDQSLVENVWDSIGRSINLLTLHPYHTQSTGTVCEYWN